MSDSQDLGERYYHKVTAPLVLTSEDEQAIHTLMQEHNDRLHSD